MGSDARQRSGGGRAWRGNRDVLRRGPGGGLACAQGLERDAKADAGDFVHEPRMVERFGADASPLGRGKMDEGHAFVLLAAPETRIYVRMIVELSFATLPVLSHLEIARGVQIKALGTLS